MGIRGTFSKQCAYHTLHPANSYTHTNNFVLHKRWKKRRAYALGTEHKILDTVISLHFFSHQDHISRPSHIFFIKNATMSTPPCPRHLRRPQPTIRPSPTFKLQRLPLLHPLCHSATAQRRHCSLPLGSAIPLRTVTALYLVPGASSPIKKGADGRSSPHKQVSIGNNVVIVRAWPPRSIAVWLLLLFLSSASALSDYLTFDIFFST